MDITSSNNPTCDGNGRSRVASSSFEVDDGVIRSSSLMILNTSEASDLTSENEPIDQLNEENLNQQVGQIEIGNDEPYVDQVFSSIDEVKRFYNVYAFKTEFSIRNATHYKAKRLDGLVTSITYTCSKEGHAKPPTQKKETEIVSETNRTPQKEFPNQRTGCKALMRLRMIEDGKWIVM
ncbi:protein FAR1-RELATED SEQUENCE 12-like [Ananas comosus]|uniref:Protein FAR1-RELATED SEQUENCE 12-like n=1 Tax=Ananas comosus TaxID=4615 RepID=A0A6P5GX67_ANACO|nr:protein FAR1-RELATED SEQUENCE 12-like [Ananas comosus]